ncbi:MAG: hypothetical protein GY917_08320 [Planctomycetaceae bacterium]|nr:hypothetical protein [Planctomycetaceae bacterium]
MKRLLICLLLVAVVGCGKSEQHEYDPVTVVNKEAFWISDPNNPNNVKIET